VTSPDNSTPDLGHVNDPALARPEASGSGGIDDLSRHAGASPSDMPTTAARRASRWGAVWMVLVLVVIVLAVVAIIEK
jgi:hypothetical protein